MPKWMFVLVLIACGPSVSEPRSDVGVLEYSDSIREIYRDGLLIHSVVGPDYSGQVPPPAGQGYGCWQLESWAVDEIEAAFESLDPTVDYSVHGGDPECTDDIGEDSMFHREGFEHSPIACARTCCHPSLEDISAVYFYIRSNIVGQAVVIDGVSYDAVVGSVECPDQ